jgi:hypothetical protein
MNSELYWIVFINPLGGNRWMLSGRNRVNERGRYVGSSYKEAMDIINHWKVVNTQISDYEYRVVLESELKELGLGV